MLVKGSILPLKDEVTKSTIRVSAKYNAQKED